MLGLLKRRKFERTGHELYVAAVSAARAPAFYTDFAIPDTLDGRFDLISLHVFLVIRRLTALPEPGPAIAQAVFDAMFSDMDINLREMGVSDLSVGKRVKVMWEAFHGRSQAYQAALAAEDASALAAALARNIWPAEVPAAIAARLAAHVLMLDAALAGQPLADLCAGRVAFPGVMAASA